MANPMAMRNNSMVEVIIEAEDTRPRVIGRKRRVSAGSSAQRSLQDENGEVSRRVYGISTPPSTPHRTKKRVRFSEPSPSTTTGLTPFFGRNSISSPPPSRSRRHSTPSSRWNLAVDDSPIICGELQFKPLRQILTGRVKRQIRRRGISEEINIIEAEEKYRKRNREAMIEFLTEELLKKDEEIENMKRERDNHIQVGQEAGGLLLDSSQIDGEIDSLQLEIITLQAQRRGYELDATTPGESTQFNEEQYQYDDDTFSPTHGDEFNLEMTEVFLSTPARRSFPSPPATVSNTPSTTSAQLDNHNDAQSIDAERSHLESQLKVLQEQLVDLSKTFELTNTTHERLIVKLAPFVSDPSESEKNGNLDAALDRVLTQLALSESAALDNSAQFSALSTELQNLFPSSKSRDPESILEQLHSQFRAARLELEYLTPGENSEGFENCKLLDMLVSRLRFLTKKVHQQDADIDQYHSQEISLRQQLGSRVDAMSRLQETLSAATANISKLESDVHERDESISKLTHALQGYRDEVSGLETFINRLEVEHAADTAILREEMESSELSANSKTLDLELEIDTFKATAEGREMLMRELEKRLIGAIASARTLEDDFKALQDENGKLRNAAQEKEIFHGNALALRDARVVELIGELENEHEKLRRAHEKIVQLNRENRSYREQEEATEATKAKLTGNLSDQLALVNNLGSGSSDGSTRDTSSSSGRGSSVVGGSTSQIIVNPKPGLLFNASLARRRSNSAGKGKKRRRNDSGLSFLEEEGEALESSVCA